MPHRLPLSARLALGAVKLTVLGSIVTVGWASQSMGAPGVASDAVAVPSVSDYTGSAGSPVADRPARLQRMLDAHDCSVTGFDGDVQPTSAVVRSATGHLRFVSFDTGWRIYRRHGAAQLVAVCRDAAPGSGLTSQD